MLSVLIKPLEHIALKGNALTGDFFDSWFLNLQALGMLYESLHA
jgi:hypothetical protein